MTLPLSVQAALRRQLLTLAQVHAQSYYRAALMPVIKGMMARLEGRA